MAALRRALAGTKQDVVDYVKERFFYRRMGDLIFFGESRYGSKEILLIFHQSRRLFKIQDRLRAE